MAGQRCCSDDTWGDIWESQGGENGAGTAQVQWQQGQVGQREGRLKVEEW